MKRTILILNLLIVFISSCDRRKYCNDFYILDKIEFFNTTIDGLNNIKIYGYEKGSDFTQIIDSSYYITEFKKTGIYNNLYTGYLNKNLNTDLDYIINFNLTNKHCKISEINIKESLCYNGLFHKEYEYSFGGYLVNGEPFACQIIKVFPE